MGSLSAAVCGCPGAELGAEGVGGAVQGSLGGAGGVGFDGAGQQLGQGGVVTGGQAELDVTGGPNVVLGRAAGARSPTAAAALVAGFQQAVVDELVEVIGGQRAADADGRGGVLAAHRLPALGHVPVQRAAERVTQPGKAGELLIDVARVHAAILKQILLDN